MKTKRQTRNPNARRRLSEALPAERQLHMSRC